MSGRVQGYCPMGCGQTLILGDGGYVTCSRLSCPRPDAVSEILDTRETEHIVDLRSDEFTIWHPLRERLDDALLDCQLHKRIAALDGPPHEPGRWRVLARPGSSDWSWVAVS